MTIQAQVLELLHRLTTEAGTALILITHDLGVVAGMTQRINVMYAGFIVETATTAELFERALAPVHGRAAPFDPAPRRRRGRGAHPDRGPAAGHAPGAGRLPVRAALRLAVAGVLVVNPPLLSLTPERPVVPTGPEASHRIACHNPPTAEEAASGRPLRPGFQAAPPPGDDQLANVVDELAVAAEEAALIDETLREAGPISAAPSAAGLPIQPEPPDTPDRRHR